MAEMWQFLVGSGNFKMELTLIQFTNKSQNSDYKKGKGHPCTGTEALYRPYGP